MSSSPTSPTASAPSVLPSSPLSSVPSDDNSKDELVDVQPSEVEFLETLSTKTTPKNFNNLVVTLKVEIRGKLCVMKVFKTFENWPNYYWREVSAYRLLREKGFCKRGLVPKFYGTIENIDVLLWPKLSQFQDDKYMPHAVLIEYIPDAKMISLEHFSPESLEGLSAILAEFHEVGLRHGDTFPRNMMVVQGTPRARVFWLDLDVSQVVDRKTCTNKEKNLLKEESQWMENFAKALTNDAKNGKLEEAWAHYYL